MHAPVSPKIAAPTVPHSMAHLVPRQLDHAWPFPVSVTAAGLVRNVSPAPVVQPKRRRGKPPGSIVTLTAVVGDMPELGNVLLFGSGRRYAVQSVKGRSVTCLVLEPTASTGDAVVLPWRWTVQARQAGSGGDMTQRAQLRVRVREKTEGRCYHCSHALSARWEIDHLLPRSRGGRHTFANMVPSCVPCNQQKSDTMPDEWARRANLAAP